MSELERVKEIERSWQALLDEFICKAGLVSGDILVVGCSTSEIMGKAIGKGSSQEIGCSLCRVALKELTSRGIFLAGQCCEHLNRALVVERDMLKIQKHNPVCVVPQLHAGGAFATACYRQFKDPVLIEEIQAQAGIDIGDCLIGMHLQPVAVPIRLTSRALGKAHLVCAKTRPKLIGGARAIYE